MKCEKCGSRLRITHTYKPEKRPRLLLLDVRNADANIPQLPS
jgi:hypothetical protein